MVAIWGVRSGQMIVANKLPPKAGLVANNSSLSSVMLNSNNVASAVNPVWTRAEIRGPKSRPINVDPRRNTSKWYLLRTAVKASE